MVIPFMAVLFELQWKKETKAKRKGGGRERGLGPQPNGDGKRGGRKEKAPLDGPQISTVFPQKLESYNANVNSDGEEAKSRDWSAAASTAVH